MHLPPLRENPENNCGIRGIDPGRIDKGRAEDASIHPPPPFLTYPVSNCQGQTIL